LQAQLPPDAAAATGYSGPSVNASPQAEGAGGETRRATAGVLQELSSAFASARAALSGFLDLVSLEARRAGLALMWMVIWGLIAVICFAAAWLGLMGALALWIVSLGFPPLAAVIALALANLVAGGMLIYACVGMSRALLFSATRRQVAGEPPAGSPTP
jgi:hypothetical protein